MSILHIEYMDGAREDVWYEYLTEDPTQLHVHTRPDPDLGDQEVRYPLINIRRWWRTY